MCLENEQIATLEKDILLDITIKIIDIKNKIRAFLLK